MRQTNTEEYANGLAQMSNWKSTVTIRPSYKLKPHTSDRLIERISKRLKTRIFYTMERDKEPIKSKQAISGYIVKHLNNNHSHHNIF